ncbi:RluA family pseudouridine synthase [Ruminococcaceae bacterium OttesenSCG-928-A16]|nr:RluA family pseudouridine synthase [Ruminococcaceae bacterium OttesenSCG-928-A16]
METIDAVVQSQEAGARLDRYLSALLGVSRAVAQQLIAGQHVTVNGKAAPKSYQVAAGDTLQIELPPPDDGVQPQDIPLDIVYEDEYLLVVNKPKGMVVHPAPGNPNGTLVNALLHHCGGQLSGMGGETRPGIVHRIDKATSGLLVAAKDDDTHQHLAQQFAQHSITRVYHAVVYGTIKQPDGEVDAPIGRDKRDRKKMAVTQQNAKQAVTHYQVLQQYNGFAHLALQLQTGRTHQIRVHMASIGHPVAGDAVYGPKKVITQLHGQCLHAKTLGFVHPATGEHCLFNSKLPPYFTAFLEKIEKL